MLGTQPPQVKPEIFYKHLDECQRCREQPFNLCAVGAHKLAESVGLDLLTPAPKVKRP